MKLADVINAVADAYFKANPEEDETHLRLDFKSCESIEGLSGLLEALGFSSDLDAKTFILDVIVK